MVSYVLDRQEQNFAGFDYAKKKQTLFTRIIYAPSTLAVKKDISSSRNELNPSVLRADDR